MSTQFTNRQWRLPNNENKAKQSNYSMDFDGSNDKIIVDTSVNNVLTTGNQPFSISIWFNVDSVSNSYNEFFGYGQPGVGLSGVRVYGGVFKHNSVSGIYGSDLNSTTVIQTGQWYHGAVTFDGTTRKIYVDGVLENSDTPNLAILPSASYPLTIGVYPSRTKYTYGKIDAACFFDYALSQSQVTTLYGSSSTGIGNPMSLSPKPVAYYPLGDQDVYNGASYLTPNASLKDFVFDFDGSDDYIDCGSPSSLDFERTDAFSISAWVKRVGSGSYQSIVYKANNNSPYNGYAFYIDNNNKVGFNVTIDYNSNNYFGKVCTSVLNTDWNNVLITYNGNSNVSGLNIYINGSLQTVITVGTSSDLTGTLSNSIPFNIGARNNTDVFLDGELSNTQIFNTALPATGSNSVETLYNNGSPLTSMSGFTSLQGWYKLDASATYDSSTTTWTIPDDSSNSNTGTSSGMSQANLVQSDLSFTSGYSPYALDFDGANDYISVTTSSITGNDARTMSFWYKTTSSSAMIPFSIGNPSSFGIANSQFAYCINNGSTTQAAVFAIASNDVTPITGVPATNDGNWHNVVVSWSGSVLSLHIDGASYSTPQPAGNYNTTAGFKMGGWGNNDRKFNGQLSNCSVWNTALTSAQVSEIYSEGIPQNLLNHSAVSSLVSWWQLGSNSSFNTNWTVLDEVTASGNNGTSVNMTEADIVDGVGSYANGLSSGMGGDEVIGDAPYSTANALSVNMDVLDRVTDTPS